MGAENTAMTLKPSARLQRFLGQELIADPNLAVLEFVKNAYDAGADRVEVKFHLSEEPTSLSVADNGIGMNEESFRYNWLRPGFSQKATSYRGDAPAAPATTKASQRAAKRKPAGEKGLGRLSAGRLGAVLTVWTRPSASAQWLVVTFDWSRFDDMYSAMDEISIPFEYRDTAPAEAFDKGTLVQITDLTQAWIGRVPGRPAPGRPRTRLGRLKQDLSFLIRAQGNKTQNFKLKLDSDVVTLEGDVGEISPETSRLDTAQYVYRFALAGEEGEEGQYSVRVERSLERSAEAVKATGKNASEKFQTVMLEVAASEWPGPVSGYFLYTPPPAGRRAQDIDLAPTGVLLYRDEVLVEPYGLPGNDWLGVEARKASRQGHAAIQPSTLSGEVQISRENNPTLVDMSNRLGLLDNDESSEFVRLMRSEFAFFEELIYQEVLIEGNWQGKKQEKAAKQAVLAEEVAQLRLKALSHRAGQPLQAMGFDVIGLQGLANEERIPADLRQRLQAYAEKFEVNVTRLAKVVGDLSSLPSLTASEVRIEDIADQVAMEVAGLAEQHSVEITTGGAAEMAAFVPRDLVFEVIHELVTNAIEVPRKAPGVGFVRVDVENPRPECIDVVVVDDGAGFAEQASLVEDLSEIQSTKGRPAEGLITAENSAVAMRGALAVRRTSTEGTVMVLRLPTGVSPVPAFDQ